MIPNSSALVEALERIRDAGGHCAECGVRECSCDCRAWWVPDDPSQIAAEALAALSPKEEADRSLPAGAVCGHCGRELWSPMDHAADCSSFATPSVEREAVAKIERAILAFENGMCREITGSTEAERRSSDGERNDSANEAMFEALTELSISDLRALLPSQAVRGVQDGDFALAEEGARVAWEEGFEDEAAAIRRILATLAEIGGAG